MRYPFELTLLKIFKKIAFVVLAFIFIRKEAQAQTGITWTSRTSVGNSTWKSVVYGNGKFVAVGSTGGTQCVMTSPDGVTWTLQTAISGSWSSVTFGNNTFVAVAYGGTNQVMTSPDGITWTSRTPAASNTWGAVAFGNGVFVAVADGGTISNDVMTSADNGVTWTSRTSVFQNNWTAITFGNNQFVAVAYSGNGTANQVMTSPNGITWTRHASTADNDWAGITYGNNLYVAVAQNTTGGGTQVMTSPDGATWTGRTQANGTAWNNVTYGGGLYVAVSFGGSGNEVMTSPDGITWTTRTSAANNTWSGITYANGIFVVVGGGGSTTNRVMTSGTFITVPLNWLSVKGDLNNALQACIKWDVEERSVAGYVVEKSTDGINYSPIGSISSKGNGDNSYSFTEQQLLMSTTWYRVKQIDIGDRFSYSSVIILRNGNNSPKSVYPNPVEVLTTVLVDKNSLNKTAVLTDVEGKTLQTIRISSLSFTVNVANYPAGLYLLKIGNERPVTIVKE